MKLVFGAACVAIVVSVGAAEARTFAEMFPGQQSDIDAGALEILQRFDYQQGKVLVGNGFAEIDIGPGFYFLGSFDAREVMETLWGNPPDDTLGMIFPVGSHPLQANWGIEILWEPIGHVSDDRAASYDYDKLLRDMQKNTRDNNTWMRENGYPTSELIGWAAVPSYDAEGHELYWAQQIRFEGMDEDTLNYEIRALGRKGVMSLNFIADIAALEEVEAAVPKVLAMTSFTDGNRYDDFIAGTDPVAETDFAGLISGGAMTQFGIVAAALILLKKFWFVLLLPVLWLRRLFGGRRNS